MKAMILTYATVLIACILVTSLAVMTMSSSYHDVMQQNLDDALYLSVSMLQRDRESAEAAYIKSATAGFGDNVTDYGSLLIPKSNLTVSTVNGSAGFIGGDATQYSESTADDQLKADFLRYLTANLDSRVTALEVNIFGADYVNGILSAEIIATFQYPAGSTGTVRTYKTVILDKEKK